MIWKQIIMIILISVSWPLCRNSIFKWNYILSIFVMRPSSFEKFKTYCIVFQLHITICVNIRTNTCSIKTVCQDSFQQWPFHFQSTEEMHSVCWKLAQKVFKNRVKTTVSFSFLFLFLFSSETSLLTFPFKQLTAHFFTPSISFKRLTEIALYFFVIYTNIYFNIKQ